MAKSQTKETRVRGIDYTLVDLVGSESGGVDRF